MQLNAVKHVKIGPKRRGDKKLPVEFISVYGNLRNLYLPCFVFPLHVWDVAQHDVDEGVLDQAEEHEERTRRHENVNSLKKSKRK